jgi:hypothetical protein
MNDDLTPTFAGRGETTVRFPGRPVFRSKWWRRGDLAEQPGRGLVAEAVMVWAPQDRLDANEILTGG